MDAKRVSAPMPENCGVSVSYNLPSVHIQMTHPPENSTYERNGMISMSQETMKALFAERARALIEEDARENAAKRARDRARSSSRAWNPLRLDSV